MYECVPHAENAAIHPNGLLWLHRYGLSFTLKPWALYENISYMYTYMFSTQWALKWVCIISVKVSDLNTLNATGVYTRLIFTSRERKWGIYMPALYLGSYRANKWSLAAVWSKTLCNCWGHAFSLTSLSRKSRKGRCYFLIERDLVKGCQTQSFFSNDGSKQSPAFTLNRSTIPSNNLEIGWICQGYR